MERSGFASGDWYDTPLYYDIVFDEGTAEETDFLEAALRRYGKLGRRRVLEPACGSGRLLESLADRGYRVVGFDASPVMVEYSRRRLAGRPDARVFQARLEGFAVEGRFDLAHCLVSTFKYLLDEKSARSHLQCVARALRPGGIYVLGFHLSDYSVTRRSRERWVGRRGRTKVICNIQSWAPERRKRRERVRSRLTVERSGRRLGLETSWWFRTYDAAQARRLFRSVPELELVGIHDFSLRLDREWELNDDLFDGIFILRRT